jgi:hypothetical protein
MNLAFLLGGVNQAIGANAAFWILARNMIELPEIVGAGPSGHDVGRIAGAVPISVSRRIGRLCGSTGGIFPGKISIIWSNFPRVGNIPMAYP